MRLKNKVAIITGGAMGNGLGITKVFLKEGADVIILDYSEKLNDTIKELKQEYENVTGYQVDIRDTEKIHNIVEEIIKEKEKIDILINNAGVAKLIPFLEMTDEMRDYHFDINMKGTWNVTKAILPYMKEKKYGRIVNLSSVTGPMVADAGEVAYATTKAALIGFTKSLAKEVGSRNILVNAVAPGFIETQMTDVLKEEVKEEISKSISLKRMGTVQDVANVVKFLASDDSSYITGQIIQVDGGMI